MKVKEIESHDMNIEDDDMCLSKPVRNLESLTNELIEALESAKLRLSNRGDSFGIDQINRALAKLKGEDK
jgi:SMC interacting uncharacterized protein involved in chromosome segregation